MPTHKSNDYKLSAVKYYLSHSKNQVHTCKIFGCSARKLKETTHVWELSGGTTGRGGWVLKPQSSTSTDVVDGKVIASSSSKPPASKKRSACAGCECGGCNKFKKIKSAASEYLAAADILSREMDTL